MDEPPPEDVRMDTGAYTVDDMDPAMVEEPDLIVLLPDKPEGVPVEDLDTDVHIDEQPNPNHLTVPDDRDAGAAAAITTVTTPEAAATALDSSAIEPPQDGTQAEVYDEDGFTSTESSGTRPSQRGATGGATWRAAPRTASTASSRKPFRPRVDTSGGSAPPPAWKQFEGCALHLRPTHHGHQHHHATQQHKRHGLLPWPGSTASAPRGLGPLHVVPPASWHPQRYSAVAAAPPAVPVHTAFWAMPPSQQPVWGAAAAQGAPWGQHALPPHLQPVMYAPPVQGYPPGVLHMQPASSSAAAPTSPLPGPAWTC